MSLAQKGKGTTSFLTSELLQVYGAKVGLFTSPHLVDIRERIVVNGEMLSQERFAQYFFDVYDRHESLATSESEIDREVASKANFFRLMFLMSIHAFASEGVDVGVMEVGIGGRLDATNIVQPVACAITSLGMDHMEMLGDTIDKIVREGWDYEKGCAVLLGTANNVPFDARCAAAEIERSGMSTFVLGRRCCAVSSMA